MAEHREKVEKREKKPEVPWIEIYDGFFILETQHGCLVSMEGHMCFVPGGAVSSFPLLVKDTPSA